MVLIATFDPKTRVSTICFFTISIGGSSRKPIGSNLSFKTWALGDSEIPVSVAGEKDFYEKYVEAGAGKRLIVHKPKPTISDTDADYGRLRGIDVIRAASTVAGEMRTPFGIGGPIDVALVDGASDVKVQRVPNFDSK